MSPQTREVRFLGYFWYCFNPITVTNRKKCCNIFWKFHKTWYHMICTGYFRTNDLVQFSFEWSYIIYIYIYIYHKFIYICVYIYICLYIYICVCVCVYIYVWVFVYIYIYIYMIVIYLAFCLDIAQGRMNGALNETRTYSWGLANHYTTRGAQIFLQSYLLITIPTNNQPMKRHKNAPADTANPFKN